MALTKVPTHMLYSGAASEDLSIDSDTLFLDVSTIKDDLDKIGINLKEVLELSLIQKEIEEAREKAEREAAKEAEKNK